MVLGIVKLMTWKAKVKHQSDLGVGGERGNVRRQKDSQQKLKEDGARSPF